MSSLYDEYQAFRRLFLYPLVQTLNCVSALSLRNTIEFVMYNQMLVHACITVDLNDFICIICYFYNALFFKERALNSLGACFSAFKCLSNHAKP